MAKCDTCKANKVCDHERFGFENCDNYIATDIVPRAEVEYWKEQCFNACMGNGCLDHKVVIEAFNAAEGHDDPVGEEGECGMGIKCESVKNAKAEVAREIFEEIIIAVFSKLPSDVLLVRRDCDFTDGVRLGKREAFFDMIKTLVELKKKYTD